MRELIIERITELWDDGYHPSELDLSLEELVELSNKELLDAFEEMVGFNG